MKMKGNGINKERGVKKEDRERMRGKEREDDDGMKREKKEWNGRGRKGKR